MNLRNRLYAAEFISMYRPNDVCEFFNMLLCDMRHGDVRAKDLYAYCFSGRSAMLCIVSYIETFWRYGLRTEIDNLKYMCSED